MKGNPDPAGSPATDGGSNSSSTGTLLLLLSAPLLQHSSMGDLEIALALLATSKSVRRMLHEHGRGCITADLTLARSTAMERAQQFAAWLAQHAHLLGALYLRFSPHSVTPQVAEAVEAAALTGLQQAKQQQQQQAQSSTQQQQLCVQEFAITFAGRAADALLQQLPDSLTQLDLSNSPGAVPCNVSSSTLAAFTRLRTLKLNLEAGHLAPLLDGLPALQQLQSLSAVVVGSEDEVVLLQQRLPQHLQHFTLLLWQAPVPGVEWEEVWPPLHKQQLTGLKTLAVGNISASSQLPTQLKGVVCCRCPSVQPLLGLRQLQQLDFSDAPAAELRQLSSLTALTNIELRYTGEDAPSTVSNAAAAWPAIARKVKTMTLAFYEHDALEVPLTSLQQLSCLTALAMLTLDMNVGPLPATPAQIASILLNLRQLQTLEISTDTLHTALFMPEAEAAAAAAVQHAAAVAAAQQAEAAQEVAAVAAAHGAANAAEAAEAAAAAAGDAALAAVVAMQAAVAAAAGLGPGQAGANAAEIEAGPGNGVDGDEPGYEAGDGGAAAGEAGLHLVPVLRAIVQLPQLVSLKLKGPGTTAEALDHITGMTRFTRLTISGLGFDDAALNSMACSLTGLRRLSLSDAGITDAPLMVVAKMLQQLTEVELSNCSYVTDRRVRWLAQLPCLQAVVVGRGSGISAGAVAAALRMPSRG